ncbi:MAG: hypothetical protein ACRYFA_08385 [Janthinobacterium lividum]
MKKLYLIIVLAATTVFTVSAQKKTIKKSPLFSVGLELGIPTGDMRNFNTVGFGGSGKIEIPATKNLYITATAGYTTYYLKDSYKNLLRKYNYTTTPDGYVPLKVGGKYYFNPAFYAEGEIGASFGTNDRTSNYFVYSPGIGTSIPLTGKNAIDIGLRFEGWSQNNDFNQFALRAAYKF